MCRECLAETKTNKVRSLNPAARDVVGSAEALEWRVQKSSILPSLAIILKCEKNTIGRDKTVRNARMLVLEKQKMDPALLVHT